MTTHGAPAPGPSAEAGPATATPVSSDPTRAANASGDHHRRTAPPAAVRTWTGGTWPWMAPSSRGRGATSRPAQHLRTAGPVRATLLDQVVTEVGWGP